MQRRKIRAYSDAQELTQGLASLLYPGQGRAWMEQLGPTLGITNFNVDDITISQHYLMQIALYGELTQLLNETEEVMCYGVSRTRGDSAADKPVSGMD